ncbi:hypothetical protein [Coleofasciculus sp. E2-BRE-01]|uniref:hypothetical protein n=1 Tax=Coleofasciculus sp. E2-BRE-01 TaxID=3069524 RepID=UPI0033000647
MAHIICWIRIVGAHGVRPISPPNLSHNFSCVSPVLAWHTLFAGLERETRNRRGAKTCARFNSQIYPTILAVLVQYWRGTPYLLD